MKRIEKEGKGREGRVQPSLGERVLPRPPVLTHHPLDHGHGQGCPITTNASPKKGPSSVYSPFAIAALFRVDYV